jgi:hypothetical protein
LGPGSTIALILEKRRKQKAYEKMLAEVRASSTIAVFNGFASSASQLTAIDALEREKIVARANAMLRDENLFFTFPYALRRIQQPWNYDPIEATYWPKRHYTEVLLHAPDTPRDVKIVWEINRFKDLPILAQAASLTGDTKYRQFDQLGKRARDRNSIAQLDNINRIAQSGKDDISSHRSDRTKCLATRPLSRARSFCR